MGAGEGRTPASPFRAGAGCREARRSRCVDQRWSGGPLPCTSMLAMNNTLETVLIVLAIVALLIFIVGYARRR